MTKHAPSLRTPSATTIRLNFGASEYNRYNPVEVVAFESQDGEPLDLELLAYPMFQGQGIDPLAMGNTFSRVFLELAVVKGAQHEPGREHTNVELWDPNNTGSTTPVHRFTLPSNGLRVRFCAKAARLRLVQVDRHLLYPARSLSFILFAALTPTNGASGLEHDCLLGGGPIPKGAREMRVLMDDDPMGAISLQGPGGDPGEQFSQAIAWEDWSPLPRWAYYVAAVGVSSLNLDEQVGMLAKGVQMEFR